MSGGYEKVHWLLEDPWRGPELSDGFRHAVLTATGFVDAPIFASTEVLDDAANPVSGEAEEQEQIVDEFRQFIEQVNPDDFG